MSKGQNKTNKKVAMDIENAFKEHKSSETSVSGFKERDLEPSRKNLKR
ncbi:hypothetical protein [Haloimpatiens lingqiaonensis]|nr:hypothetical protein [Haloimpatiens lingqiaonensis]